MAQIQTKIIVEINPANPVSEVCSVIMAITAFHPGQEEKVLQGIQAAIAKRLDELKQSKK